jgi:hypothetical protein
MYRIGWIERHPELVVKPGMIREFIVCISRLPVRHDDIDHSHA